MVETCKFLGIIINSSIDWSDHINLINRKVSKTIGILKCVRHKLPENILRSLYFFLVNPYYEYGNIVWAVKNTVSLQNSLPTWHNASFNSQSAASEQRTGPLPGVIYIYRVYYRT